MSLMMARSGIERNMPEMPHKALPANTTIMEKSALIFTLEETIKGTIRLLSMSWMI
jgi:hypothetical protein